MAQLAAPVAPDMNTCRICLQNNKTTIPIDTNINQESGALSILSIIKQLNKDEVVDGAIDNLSLPQQVCLTCFTRTTDAFLLIQELSNSHRHFLSKLPDLNDREGNAKVVHIRLEPDIQPVLPAGEIHCIECNEQFPAESILSHFVAGRCKLTLKSNSPEVEIDNFDSKKTIACKNCESVLFKCDISKRSAICANIMPAQKKIVSKIDDDIPTIIDLTDVDCIESIETKEEDKDTPKNTQDATAKIKNSRRNTNADNGSDVNVGASTSRAKENNYSSVIKKNVYLPQNVADDMAIPPLPVDLDHDNITKTNLDIHKSDTTPSLRESDDSTKNSHLLQEMTDIQPNFKGEDNNMNINIQGNKPNFAMQDNYSNRKISICKTTMKISKMSRLATAHKSNLESLVELNRKIENEIVNSGNPTTSEKYKSNMRVQNPGNNSNTNISPSNSPPSNSKSNMMSSRNMTHPNALNTTKENTSKQKEGKDNGSSVDLLKLSHFKSNNGLLKAPIVERFKFQVPLITRTTNTNILGNQVFNTTVQQGNVQAITISQQIEIRKRLHAIDNACQIPEKTGKPA